MVSTINVPLTIAVLLISAVVTHSVQRLFLSPIAHFPGSSWFKIAALTRWCKF